LADCAPARLAPSPTANTESPPSPEIPFVFPVFVDASPLGERRGKAFAIARIAAASTHQ